MNNPELAAHPISSDTGKKKKKREKSRQGHPTKRADNPGLPHESQAGVTPDSAARFHADSRHPGRLPEHAQSGYFIFGLKNQNTEQR